MYGRYTQELKPTIVGNLWGNWPPRIGLCHGSIATFSNHHKQNDLTNNEGRQVTGTSQSFNLSGFGTTVENIIVST